MRRMATTMTVLAGFAVMAAPVLGQAGGPGSMILERRAELGLTDAQVQAIEAIRAEAVERQAAVREQVRAEFGDRATMRRDGLRPMGAERRSEMRQMTDEQRAEMRQRMQEQRGEMRKQMQERRDRLQPIMAELRQANREAGERIHEVLTAE